MLINYLRHNGNYTPKNYDDEIKLLFDLEIQFWGISLDKVIPSKLPQELIDLLKSEPIIDTKNEKQQQTLKKWKELGLFSFLDIDSHNAIDFDVQL